jgi:pyruvate kinase
MNHADDPDTMPVAELIRRLSDIRADMVRLAASAPEDLSDPRHQASARNLLHYLALRRHDLRPLQNRLSRLGLSSLGRAEASVLATVDAVLSALHHLEGGTPAPRDPADAPPVDFAAGVRLLDEHTEALLGPAPSDWAVRIMVTMPGEAADDYTLVHDLLRQGMDCMRINCAHDDAGAWARMIAHLRRAEQALGRPCRVLMDLGGPKLRTGPLEPGPPVIKWRPRRDAWGRVIAPARVWLTAEEEPAPPPTPADGALPVPADWLARLSVGDRIAFADTRGSSRTLRVVDVDRVGCWAEARDTAYVAPGTGLRLRRQGVEKGRRGQEPSARVGALPPPPEAPIRLAEGDLLILTADPSPGRPATRDSLGRVLSPARIGCTLPEVFADVGAGEAVWLDDGKIGGVVERSEADRLHVRITQARPAGKTSAATRASTSPTARSACPRSQTRTSKTSPSPPSTRTWSGSRSSTPSPMCSPFRSAWRRRGQGGRASCSRSRPGARSSSCRRCCWKRCGRRRWA